MEASLLIALVVLLLVVLLRHQLLLALRIPTPAGAILLTSISYIVGAAIVELREQSDTGVLICAVSIALFALYLMAQFAISKALGLQALPRNLGISASHKNALPPGLVWAFFALTLVSAFTIVFVTGASKLLSALYQFIAFGDVDTSVLELRLNLATGEERWIAPGYTKQIRDVLLPLGTFLVLFALPRKRLAFVALAIIVIPTVALLMISSGERAPVILFLVGGAYAAMRCEQWGFQSRGAVTALLVLMAVIVLGAFYSLTSSFTSREYGDTSTAAILLDRVVTRMPEENVVGAPVWSRGAPFPGAGWLLEIASVLPGPQATLSNLIHEHIGGGDRGNSVLGMWVDVYYNFGWLLGVPVALLLGVVSALFNHWVNRLRSESSTAEICGLWLSVCMLFVFSPFGFLLYGPFVLSVFLVFVSILLPRIGASHLPANMRLSKGSSARTAAIRG